MAVLERFWSENIVKELKGLKMQTLPLRIDTNNVTILHLKKYPSDV